MDVFPKFIIETDDELGDCLIIAKCTYHKQLATDVSKVKGGGWWILKQESNTMILHGDSTDFGKATLQDIIKCIEKGNVYRNKSCQYSIVDNFNFSYNTGSEIIVIK